jgi:hypothetical protein
MGIALLTTVLAAVGTTHVIDGHSVANLAAYHAAFLTAAGVALIGSGVALTISDADAAATMVRRITRRERPSGGPTAQRSAVAPDPAT